MDKKLNDRLIQEIRNTILSLQKDKAQLNEELKKYDGRENSPEKTEFEADRDLVSEEIKEKDADLEKIFRANATKHRIEKEMAKMEQEYGGLVKQREECKAEIEKLKGRMELENGQFVPTREQREYEADLGIIEEKLAKYYTAKAKNQSILDEQETIAEDLAKKYKIREKYKDLEENKDGNDKNTGEGEKDDSKEEKEEIKDKQNGDNDKEANKDNSQTEKQPKDIQQTTEPAKQQPEAQPVAPQTQNNAQNQQTTMQQQPKGNAQNQQATVQQPPVTYNATRSASNLGSQSNPIEPKTITSITCSVEKGRLIYRISGLDNNGKEYIISKTTNRAQRVTGKEKREMKELIDNGLKNVDISIYRMLKNEKVFKDDNLLKTYLKQVSEISSGLGRHKNDIKMTYDLRNIKEAKIGFLSKLKIKNFASKAQKNKIAEYIKPQGRLKGLLTGMKQQDLLEAGRSIANVDQEKLIKESLDERPREQQVWSAYKQMHDEEGFDFEQFSQDMNLSDEEKSFIQTYEKGKAMEKDFKKSLREGVTTEQPKASMDRDAEDTVIISDQKDKDSEEQR